MGEPGPLGTPDGDAPAFQAQFCEVIALILGFGKLLPVTMAAAADSAAVSLAGGSERSPGPAVLASSLAFGYVWLL